MIEHVDINCRKFGEEKNYNKFPIKRNYEENFLEKKIFIKN